MANDDTDKEKHISSTADRNKHDSDEKYEKMNNNRIDARMMIDCKQTVGTKLIASKQNLLHIFDENTERERVGKLQEEKNEIEIKIEEAKSVKCTEAKFRNNPGSIEALRNTLADDVSDTYVATDESDLRDDAADLFYCNVVEARKHQEDIIEQKKKIKIQPSQGRLYRQKQTTGRWKLKDFVRMLRKNYRTVRLRKFFVY